MKALLWITAGLGLTAWVGIDAAQAADEALTFELPPPAVAATESGLVVEAVAAPLPSPERLDFQLPVVAEAPAPFSVAETISVDQLKVLPAPTDPPPTTAANSPNLRPPPPDTSAGVAVAPPGAQPAQENSGTIAPASSASTPAHIPTPFRETVGSAAADVFAGGADSLVARAVGSAEGTRTPDGLRTAAYYGHIDPGNGVWNLGSFSYQHGAQTPEEADQRQLQRLQVQADQLRQQAIAKGLILSLEEELNGIDLANQAPIAALDRGYIDWLHQAHSSGMSGDEAILWARTRAFLDPDSGQWNAPGLGNTVSTISQDQERRMLAIAHAIAAQPSDKQMTAQASETPTVRTRLNAIADYILNLDLDFPS